MNILKVAAVQMASAWLNREASTDRILEKIREAAAEGAQLITFGEALLPGYPFWLDRTGGAEFNSDVQKDIHAHYLYNAVSVELGHLDAVCWLCKELGVSVYLGIIERPSDRGGHSLYCSLVYIDRNGSIGSVHRKLMPTYEERLCWSIGDGHGLRTHSLPPFTLGGLNCWENWMPLARASLYAQGENLHVAVWPGNERNTSDLTPVIAKESRSFVISVSGIFRPEDIPDAFPHAGLMRECTHEVLADGGSCIAAPDGSWVVAPVVNKETILYGELDYDQVLRERQNFDPSGHYARPDVFELHVDSQRQSILKQKD